MNFSGSYSPKDVVFLLKPINIEETNVNEKEKDIQSGKRHYSEMISEEYYPTPEYMDIFFKSLEQNKEKVALGVITLAKIITEMQKIKRPIIVSLARAGTPIGVLLKRTLHSKSNIETSHYSISIIRDKGLDKNALKDIIKFEKEKYQNLEELYNSIIFVDGWTGKGVISFELKKSIEKFNKENNSCIKPNLYVLADISGKADFSATFEDYLIPSSCLNSTISGLISRSILNKDFIGENDYHGCKYYKELEEFDISRNYIEVIMKEINNNNILITKKDLFQKEKKDLSFICDRFMKETMKKYNITNRNYIKPGVGETTRVLLRRIPDKIIVKNKKDEKISHIIKLAEDKNVQIVEDSTIPYSVVGLILDLSK